MHCIHYTLHHTETQTTHTHTQKLTQTEVSWFCCGDCLTDTAIFPGCSLVVLQQQYHSVDTR